MQTKHTDSYKDEESHRNCHDYQDIVTFLQVPATGEIFTFLRRVWAYAVAAVLARPIRCFAGRP
jgi:hypothetical protein